MKRKGMSALWALWPFLLVIFQLKTAHAIQRLQLVLNTAVRLVAGSSRRDHAFSLLATVIGCLLSSASSTNCA